MWQGAVGVPKLAFPWSFFHRQIENAEASQRIRYHRLGEQMSEHATPPGCTCSIALKTADHTVLHCSSGSCINSPRSIAAGASGVKLQLSTRSYGRGRQTVLEAVKEVDWGSRCRSPCSDRASCRGAWQSLEGNALERPTCEPLDERITSVRGLE